MCRRTLALPAVATARRIALFKGVQHEVHTDALFAPLKRRSKTVVFPHVAAGRVTFHRVSSLAELKAGYAGIPEPPQRAATRVGIRSIDVFLVPGMAFDREGYRLGRGGGMYDRVLATRRRESVACGLCFASQLRARLPREPHDKRVDVIVTEEGVVNVRG